MQLKIIFNFLTRILDLVYNIVNFKYRHVLKDCVAREMYLRKTTTDEIPSSHTSHFFLLMYHYKLQFGMVHHYMMLLTVSYQYPAFGQLGAEATVDINFNF